jgi:hypothetical protein
VLKYTAALSLAALLSVSPALAYPAPPVPPAALADPVPACVPQQDWLARIPSKPVARLTADDAKAFVKGVNEFAVAHPDTSQPLPPLDYTEVILWAAKEDTVVFALFVKDCSVGYGRLGTDAVAAMSREHPEPSDDGSI